MRVAYVVPGERMVLTGALGPLLYEATTGVMDVKVERIAGGSRVTLNYRAAGFANGGGGQAGAARRPGARRADGAVPQVRRGVPQTR